MVGGRQQGEDKLAPGIVDRKVTEPLGEQVCVWWGQKSLAVAEQ